MCLIYRRKAVNVIRFTVAFPLVLRDDKRTKARRDLALENKSDGGDSDLIRV